MNYAWDFSQSETEKYFEWILQIIKIITITIIIILIIYFIKIFVDRKKYIDDYQ